MTIPSTAARKAGPYACNGILTTFAFTYKIFATTDVWVVLADSSDALTTLALATHYTVSMNADQDTNPGGSITTLVAYDTGYTITLLSQVPITQATDIPNLSAFYAQVIEDALDKLTAIAQQFAEVQSRSIRGPAIDDDALGEMPALADRANMMLAFDSDGQPIAVTSAAFSGSVLVSASGGEFLECQTTSEMRDHLGFGPGTINIGAIVPPTVNDDPSPGGYARNSWWIDTFHDESYQCIGEAEGNAKWRRVPHGHTNQCGFHATPTANQTGINTITWTNVQYATEQYDLGDDYSTNTFTAPVSGEYLFTWCITTETGMTDGTVVRSRLIKNGTGNGIAGAMDSRGSTGGSIIMGSCITRLFDGDTVRVQFYHDLGSDVELNANGDASKPEMHFAGTLLVR